MDLTKAKRTIATGLGNMADNMMAYPAVMQAVNSKIVFKSSEIQDQVTALVTNPMTPDDAAKVLELLA
jgi:hypothetical protein